MCAYFSNGSEGEVLDNQCAECPVGSNPDAPCSILAVQSCYNYKQIGNDDLREAMNMLVDDKGICQMRKVMIEDCKIPIPPA